MGYHEYLKSIHNKDELISQIKEDIINSKDFVNIFLGYTVEKSDEDKDKLFNSVVEHIANDIAESKYIGA